MFSRRGLLSFLPAFLVPKAWSKKPEQAEHWALLLDKQPYEPTKDVGITQKQLYAIAVNLSLPDLKKIIEALENIEIPQKYPRSQDVNSSSFVLSLKEK